MDFVFWTVAHVRHACRLAGVENFDDDFLVHIGSPLQDSFPDDVTFRMKESFPDDTLLTDVLSNIDSFIIVSEKTKVALEAQAGLERVEFLPVIVRDHRDEPVTAKYFVLNPLVFAPVLKVDQSEAKSSSPEWVGSIRRFVVNDAAVAAAPPVFRVRGVREYIAVRKETARALSKAGLTNTRWIEPSAIATGEPFESLDYLPEEATAKL